VPHNANLVCFRNTSAHVLAQPSPAQPSLAARSARFCATERCRRCCEQALLCAPTCRAVGRLQTLLFMSSFSARSFDLQLEIAQLSAACVEVSAVQCGRKPHERYPLTR
jgi:hypothetical protein